MWSSLDEIMLDWRKAYMKYNWCPYKDEAGLHIGSGMQEEWHGPTVETDVKLPQAKECNC